MPLNIRWIYIWVRVCKSYPHPGYRHNENVEPAQNY